ncbi:MAG: TlpA disulfide reductase family protein [Pseudomonadota bacterium]
MAKVRQLLIYLALAALAITTGFMLRTQLMGGSPSVLSSEASQQGAKAIFAANLPDLQGENQTVSQWLGNVIVVNFWATWCTPCREEIPEFIETQEKFRDQGLVFVGIAIDQADKVKMFSQEFGINYPVLVGSLNTWSLLEAAGNHQSALPYTVVINRSGEIVETYLGRVNQKKLEKAVIPLLKDHPQSEPQKQASL